MTPHSFLPLLAAATALTGFSDCSDCPAMVVVPAGSATLGSTASERARAGIVPLFGDREEPPYAVRIERPFALGRTEITRGQYRAFVEDTRRPPDKSCGTFDARSRAWIQVPGLDWTHPGFEQSDSHPAVCISYADARAYTRWLAARTGKPYRLPSDAEWEYAARAGTVSAWYWGDAPEQGCTAANIRSAGTALALAWPASFQGSFVCGSQRKFTVPAASFPPNPFGLYDLVGNAFEWVADCDAKDNRDAPRDGTARRAGDCAHHYLKGGNFHTPFWLTRHAVRGAPLGDDIHMFGAGFRVARTLE